MSQCSPDSNQGCYSCVSGGMTTEPHTHRQAGRQQQQLTIQMIIKTVYLEEVNKQFINTSLPF